MISQFLIMSLRGDTIISRDFTGDVHKVKTTSEVFYTKANRWDGANAEEEAPPVFYVDGVQYLYIKIGGVYLLATSRKNVSPALVLEFLSRVANIIKDYCGVLNEESIRQNFVLLYELLDEIVDYGVPQNTATDVLKRYILNRPILPEQLPMKSSNLLAKREGKAPVISKSVLSRDTSGKKGEIFVDIVEKLSITFNSSGYVQNSAIDGSIQVKSYLSGRPLVKVALNEDLQIAGRNDGYNSYGSNYGVLLDDCNFYEHCNLDNFDIDRTITLNPSQGEFALMNYRTTREIRPPFRVTTSLNDSGPFKVELVMKIRAEFAQRIVAPALSISMPVPKSTISISFPSSNQPGDRSGKQAQAATPPGTFLEKEKKINWTLKKVQGGSEHIVVARISLNSQSSVSVKKEFGPVSLQFNLPLFNSSRLQVKYLQILNQSTEKGQNPARWIRYMTESSSYICRM
ncbi:mu subunit of clathrin adaptor [Chloropicon primus]|uniref:Mu subunit of clathrin adaptor n=1 Tax=Chloropicon primus TaxID=1764295 RepID=A0A5B8MEZ2_9CHLO|nr:mu subunit of clathrin adaptor [Chloropicon primus]UPQ98242.1 mu subunit of clathrin adaptor [Chloropicon primus]|mmetsp:Transcript_5687/g.17234  ORF Transcript_5687/g.17234 Transcript_5687/m.17234 type:complete len:458 (+) Transcript_5687:333-1706(+)|eukprot:QDZ19033.1 mu subunit of clathrin adaptor [Chloropicon primus]